LIYEDMKKAVINDHLSFFNSRDTYQNLKVPWKRGLIYYGPPGNGKTISIKATMNMLHQKNIPTLYVRTLTSYMGPEFSIKQIFGKAREYAPCYLVLEDLDTIVSEDVRSYFLNEMDGLKSNDGIFIIGSTNHLDRLDPGISKRPSRFDRKYLFPDPNLEQRIAYCHFWQKKLQTNREIDFPDKLCEAIAKITDKFSFAYIQEAFVAALLAIARRSEQGKRDSVQALTEQLDDDWLGVVDASDDEDLKKLVLWVEIKKQIEIL
ncbi:P-loop containing nucleoside triphosphate hydrolase protein, partial [Colletotrichum sublineola]